MTYVDWYKGSRTQTLTTPKELFTSLNSEFRFTLDGAADSTNHLLPLYSTEEFPVSWENHRVFCNPPWSNIPPFIELAASSEFACLLVPARVNARWFHRALELGATLKFFKGKPKFGNMPSTSPVDCLLLLFGT